MYADTMSLNSLKHRLRIQPESNVEVILPDLEVNAQPLSQNFAENTYSQNRKINVTFVSQLPQLLGGFFRGNSRLKLLFVLALIIYVGYWINYSFCDTESHLQFIHIPKTGGTTVTRVAAHNGYLWGSVHWYVCSYTPFYYFETRKYLSSETISQKRPHHVPPRDYLAEGYFKESFCVVRNPFDRVRSEYHMRAHGGEACTVETMNRTIRAWLKRYQLGQQSRYMNFGHLIPQAEFVWDENNQKTCGQVLRNEHLTEEFNRLMQRHNIGMRIGSDGSKTASNILFEFISNVYVRWTKRNVAVSGNHMNVHSRCKNLKTSDLDEKTKKLIREVYREDFARLNYSTEI